MASVVSQTVPVELLEAGDEAVIVDVDGRADLVVRLEEMGLHAGAHIRMIRAGSPCIVEVNQHRLSFRFDDSVTVLVDVRQ